MKKIADWLLWLGIIGSVVLGIVFGVSENRYGRYIYNWGIILGVSIGGSLVTYIECLVLAAFGDLVESGDAVFQLTKEIKEKMDSQP